MRTELFWILSFCGFAAVSLLCGLLVWPQLSAAWPSIEEKIDQFRRQPPLVKLVLLLFVGAFVVFGGGKTNLIDQASGTNIVIGASSPGGRISVKCAGEEVVGGVSGDAFHGNASTEVTPTVTQEDIARGWQLWEVRTNGNISYTMPEGATMASNWWVRGAYEDVKEIGLGGLGGLGGLESLEWRFPFGTNEYSSLWAFPWGKLRFELGNTNTEIVAVGAPMSAVPYRSRLWSAADTNGAKVVTWENFALNRSTNTPVNAQIELRTTGDFVTRSNEVETVYRRVDPDDWDDDGWRNDDDPDPYVWEEYWDSFWQELPDGANESAYCWIEIRPRWHSYVEFVGDGPSDLDDPYLWAKAGETYRVQLLIGKSYTITSTQPVDVVGRSSPSIEIDGNGSSVIDVVWPVTFSALEGNGSSFMMRVVPSGLGGTFTWTQHCCGLTGYGNQFWWAHERYCYCDGCYAQGWYLYEGYALWCEGGHCCCPGNDDDPYESEEDDGPYAAGASVEFSESAVIFEDVYTNTPNEVVARQSTRTTLTCIAHGGETGGTATFSIENGDKLIACSGGSLPVTRFVPPLQKVEFEVVYEGKLPSVSARDIRAKADFTERVTGMRHSTRDDRMTSVKLELEAVYIAPTNHNQSRHVYGVGEDVVFTVKPPLADIELEAVKGDENDIQTYHDTFHGMLKTNGGSARTYTCPIASCYTPNITVSWNDVVYRPTMLVVEPERIITTSASSSGWFWPGQVGSGCLTTVNYIGPMYVSFQGVKVAEIECTNAVPPIGWFGTTNYTGRLFHDYDAGAADLHQIQSGNYWTTDNAGSDRVYSNWFAGSLVWRIPIGWVRRMPEGSDGDLAFEPDRERMWDRTSRPLLIGGSEDAYRQVFEIDADGTASVQKFGYKLERGRWNFTGTIIHIDE